MPNPTHVELNAADGSLLIVETFIEDGELTIEVYRRTVYGGRPIAAACVTADPPKRAR